MSENVEQYLRNADIAFVNGQYATALELCESAIKDDSNNAQAYLGAGKACIVLNQIDEAVVFFEKAIELDDVDGEKYFNLANAKFGLGQYSEALLNYAKAEQLNCEQELLQKIYYQLGVINYLMNDKNAALINFLKSENTGVVNADLKDIVLKKIQIHIENKDYINAENAAIQLKMLAPSEFKSYQIYFQVLVALYKYEKAEEVFSEMELYADDRNEIHNQVDICLDKALILITKSDQEPDKAKEYFRQALDIFNEFLSQCELSQVASDTINIAKAEIFLKLEEFEGALETIENVALEADNQEKVDFIKLSCYMGTEKYEKANKYVQKLKDVDNIYYNYFAVYADAFISNKLTKGDELQRKHADTKYNYAIAYFKNKAFENPSDIFALIFRARLYAENAKYVKAEELVKLFPDTLKKQLEEYILACRKAE